MPKLVVSGLERPSPVERLILSTRLPFVAGCALVAVLTGLPGSLVVSYLDTLDVGKAVALAASNTGFVTFQPGGESLELNATRATLFTVFLFLALYSVRYYRSRILSAEPDLAKISRVGEDGFLDAFGGISSPLGTSLLALGLGVLYVVPRVLSSAGTFTLVFAFVGQSLNSLIVATALWEYLYAQWGLRKFGMAEVTLKPYHKDPMLGLRPLGSISVSLGVAFFSLSSVALAGSSIAGDPLNMGVLVAFLCLGVVMLYLPLNGIHRKMAIQKRAELTALQNQVDEVLGKAESGESSAESRLDGIGKLLKVHVARDVISGTPTWPFDTRTVERLTALMIAIITIVLARLAQIALHL